MRYPDRLADAGIAPSVGSRGDSSDHALAESVMGRCTTAVIRRLGPGRQLEAVEFATLDWVDWFKTRRLLEPIGYLPPAEYEAPYQDRPPSPDSHNSPSEIFGTIQIRVHRLSGRDNSSHAARRGRRPAGQDRGRRTIARRQPSTDSSNS
jgi:hypothetical protein